MSLEQVSTSLGRIPKMRLTKNKHNAAKSTGLTMKNKHPYYSGGLVLNQIL